MNKLVKELMDKHKVSITGTDNDFHFIAIDSLFEITDRSIAAESKLADAVRALDGEIILSDLYRTERDELKSKLAELEKQEPVKEKSRIYDTINCCDVVVVQMPVGFKLYAKPAEAVQELPYPTTESYVSELADKFIQPKESSGKRITEQDARDILDHFHNQYNRPGYLQYVNYWIKNEGRVLLDKLNENREPEVKAEVNIEPVGNEIEPKILRKWNYEFIELASKKWPELFGEDDSDEVNKTITDLWKGFCLAKKVTPNKTEAPLKEDLDNIINVERLGDQSIKLVFSSCRAALSFYAEALEQLPPLKDEV